MGSSLISAGAKAEAGGCFIDLVSPYAVIQGTWASNTDSTKYYLQLRNTTATDGDELNYKEYFTAGTYQINLLYGASNLGGICKIYLDNELVLTQDMYNSSVLENTLKQDSIIITTSGIKTIKIKADGKNGASSAYWLRLQSLSFRRTA